MPVPVLAPKGAALSILLIAAAPATAEIAPTGDMAALVLAEGAAPLSGEVVGPDGAPLPLSAALGERATILNFWATWCAPCLEEMPTLEALAADPPEGVAVVALSTGRDSPDRIAAFAEEAGLDRLSVLRDPGAEVGRAAGIVGLPTTLILDSEGRELARLTGTADWDGPDARDILDALAPLFTLR